MSAGKRLSTDEPLTEHDVADRLDKAALRALRIMYDARVNLGEEFMAKVKGSRYTTGAINHLRHEMDLWGIEPWAMREGL